MTQCRKAAEGFSTTNAVLDDIERFLVEGE